MSKKVELVEPVVEEAPFEVAVSPAEPVAVEVRVNTYTVKEGDSYAALGVRMKPKGVLAHEHAKYLCALNGCRPLRAGLTIKV